MGDFQPVAIDDLHSIDYFRHSVDIPEPQQPSPVKEFSPEEEYFRLCLLSLKMNFHEVNREFVFDLSASKLYK